MSEEKKVRVMIVDDHEVVRRGLEFFLASQADFEVVAEASNGLEALQLTRDVNPDVILMDLVMPEMDGLDAIRIIKNNFPDVEILVLTSFVDDEKVRTAIQNGAAGYMMKDASPIELARAIRATGRGQVYFHPEAARRLANIVRSRTKQMPAPDILTNREMDVIRLIARGLSNQEIADDLTISLKTVKTHVSSILGKLGLNSRVRVALYALRHSIVPLDDI